MKTTLTALTISSLSLLFGIFVDFDGYGFPRALGYIIGAVFWLFEIIGWLAFFKLSKRRKEYEKDNPDASYLKRRRRPGILTFFANKRAAIVDLVLPISLIMMVLVLFIPLGQTVTFIVAAVFSFASQMHCILNGINFKYIQFISQRKRRVNQ